MSGSDLPPRGSGQQEAKVAIPRLKRNEATASTSKTSVRTRKAVSKAVRETRCSGEKPRCEGCTKQDFDCRYDQARRDRLRESLQRNHMWKELLKELVQELSKDSLRHDDQKKRKMLDEVLKAIENDSPPTTPCPPFEHLENMARRDLSSGDEDDNSTISEEALVAASAGCYEDLDFLEEDLLQNREVNEQSAFQKGRDPDGSAEIATGLSGGNVGIPPFQPHRISKSGYFSRFYFYLDSSDITVEIGDPNIVPSIGIAQTLYKHYQSVVHDPFRILGDGFVEHLNKFYVGIQRGGMLAVCSKWKACMNLVFAIGARYAELTSDDSPAEGQNHLVYMWRAVNLLELKSFTTLVSAPDLLLIQAIGLLSFYYLTIGHTEPSQHQNGAWYTIGISIRHAQAAGLHLRHEDPSLSVERKTALSQTWWALHAIETALTAITGRPRVISLRDITATPPGNLIATGKRAAKGNMGPAPPSTRNDSRPTEPPQSPFQPCQAESKTSFLNGYIGIDLIMHKVLTTLYSPRTNNVSWKQMQKQIAALLAELEEWALRAFPHGLLTSTALSDVREHFSLYVYYGSAKIYITRPCLCRLDLHSKGQSEGSTEFEKKTAEACVQTALDLCSTFPEQPDPQWLYSKGPWWSSVHIIMQTVAILLLTLSRDPTHTSPVQPNNILTSIDKLTRWLRCMKAKDAVSERAFNILCHVLKTIGIPPDQGSPDLKYTQSPTFSNDPTPLPFATTYATFDTGGPSHILQSQQPPPHLQISPTAFQYSDYFSQGSHTGTDSNLPPLAEDPISPQDSSVPFTRDQMSVAFGDPVSTDFNQYTGWDNLGFGDWMGQDRSWQQPQ
ncbi:hypothetical protein J1614_011489 [Plenodomus biglobosus]|nr:hypothetical protein J1614_011489 [Plenodomus biglobosus]